MESMNDSRPAPPIPEYVDLKDFQFMPLDVQRLRDSDLASDETPQACWAAVLLWCASWHQVPAGSIPNNENWIAKQAGYMMRGKIDRDWDTVRAGALRGWVECADGRLYHAVVVEKALEAWQSKMEQRYRSECARIKKFNQRHETKVDVPTFDAWMSQGRPQGQPIHVPGDILEKIGDNEEKIEDKDKKSGDNEKKDRDVPGDEHSKGQGQGQGQGLSSVPVGTGGKPPDPPVDKSPGEMAKDELWAAGKSLLRQAGMPDAQCGSFVGKLVKQHGTDAVIEAVRIAVVERPADPPSFLKATCQRLAGERKSPNRQEELEERNRKIARELAQEDAS